MTFLEYLKGRYEENVFRDLDIIGSNEIIGNYTIWKCVDETSLSSLKRFINSVIKCIYKYKLNEKNSKWYI